MLCTSYFVERSSPKTPTLQHITCTCTPLRSALSWTSSHKEWRTLCSIDSSLALSASQGDRINLFEARIYRLETHFKRREPLTRNGAPHPALWHARLGALSQVHLAKQLATGSVAVTLLTHGDRGSHRQARTLSSVFSMAPFRSARSTKKCGNQNARKRPAEAEPNPGADDVLEPMQLESTAASAPGACKRPPLRCESQFCSDGLSTCLTCAPVRSSARPCCWVGAPPPPHAPPLYTPCLHASAACLGRARSTIACTCARGKTIYGRNSWYKWNDTVCACVLCTWYLK